MAEHQDQQIEKHGNVVRKVMDSPYGLISRGANKPRDSLPFFHYDGRMEGRGKIPAEEDAVLREKTFLWPSGHLTGLHFS